MLAMLQALDRLLIKLVLGTAIVLLMLMTIVSFYQVITRFVFEEPSVWSEVAARTLNIWMIYLGLIAASRFGALLAVDTLISRLKGRLKIALLVVIASLSIGIFLAMAWYGIDMAYRVRFQALAGIRNPFTGGAVSISWLYAALPIGAVLSALAVFARTTEDIHHIVNNASGDASAQPVRLTQDV